MMLEEAQERLKKTEITQEQLDGLNSLYILLGLDKDDFCKIIEIVGLETLLKKQLRYDRFDRAEQELSAKEGFLAAKQRLEELKIEQLQLEEIVYSYHPYTTR